MAHHSEELRPLPLEFLEWPEVLHRDDNRHDIAVVGVDRRSVDEGAHAPPVGHRQLDLLGAHLRGLLELAGQRQLFERDLPPVGVPARYHLEQLFGGAARSSDRLADAPRFAVERDRAAGGRVEDDDSHRRRFDERLEVGAGPLHLPVRPGVRDRRRRLRCEEHEDLLVLRRERLSGFLVAHEEVPQMLAPVVHRGPLQRPCAPWVRREPERAKVAGEVRHPEGRRQVPEVLEEPRSVRPLDHLLPVRGWKAGGDEVPDPSPLVDRRDHAVARAGQRAGARDGLLEHRAQVEALADPQDRRA